MALEEFRRIWFYSMIPRNMVYWEGRVVQYGSSKTSIPKPSVTLCM